MRGRRGRGVRRQADELPRATATSSRAASAPTATCRSASPTSAGCTATSAAARSPGLTRVRSIAQDDAHIYCKPEQVDAEIDRFFAMTREVYRDARLRRASRSRSRRGPRSASARPRDWDAAEQALSTAVERAGFAVRHQAGRGRLLRPEDRVRLPRRARPRLDARDDPDRLRDARALRAALRRPRRQRAPAGDAPPRDPRLARALHRASTSSTPAGDFPLWLAPVQARVLPVTRAARGLRARGRRRAAARPACAPSSTSATRSSASRSARPSCRRFPSMLVVGEQEAANGTVTPRRRHGPKRRRGADGARRVRRRAVRGDRRTARAIAPRGGTRIRSKHRRAARRTTPAINERIRAREVRVDRRGRRAARRDDARRRACAAREEEGLDLVEVAPDANPPVCRIMDYGKYKYEQKKKQAAARARAHAATLKEVKLRPRTDDHDLDFKLKQRAALPDRGRQGQGDRDVPRTRDGPHARSGASSSTR